MVGWHQPYEFEQALGVSDEQGSVAVRAQVGKEFPDMRQNGRAIKFLRMGDAVRTAQGKTDIEQGSLVHFYTQDTRSGIGVLWVVC